VCVPASLDDTCLVELAISRYFDSRLLTILESNGAFQTGDMTDGCVGWSNMLHMIIQRKLRVKTDFYKPNVRTNANHALNG
jgi:hypothetical protein